MDFAGNTLVLGSCITLSALSMVNPFPLLSESATGVADQTARNKITLGGNICGRIHFREAVLPLLLADSRMVIAGSQGVREVPIHDVFLQQMRFVITSYSIHYTKLYELAGLLWMYRGPQLLMELPFNNGPIMEQMRRNGHLLR